MVAMVFPEEFRPVCRYVVTEGQPLLEILDDELWRASGVVYARKYGDKILYIGSTDGPLGKRIRSHLGAIRNPRHGLAAPYREWAEGKQITILAYCPEPVFLLGHEIKVHRAIEAHLIGIFGRPKEPDWFVTRR
jgi:hypothetical protein